MKKHENELLKSLHEEAEYFFNKEAYRIYRNIEHRAVINGSKNRRTKK
ncbi:hypothetical protein AGMMS49944_11540 [Spirochaetia bacterium]|nr:hypothetical protein AGMMS49944_11540 [Spirochaetia bacterium]